MRTVRRIAEEEIVLVVLLCFFAAVFLTVFPPTLLVADSWLTLVGGREVFDHGLPHHDQLTVLAAGRTWTDQQWGAQLLFYGADALGGLPVVVLLGALVVVGAFALAAIGARRLGAGPAPIVLVFFLVILAAPWAWTVRAQVLALPLYVGLLWLLAAQSRRPSRLVYLAFLLLLLWANLHGSVVLGAMLTMLLAAVEIVRRRGIGIRQVLLLVVPPLLVLATPYGPVETARYYHLLLVDPPFSSNEVTEWNRSDPAFNTLFFYVLAAFALVIVVRGRRRLSHFDLAALVLTFAGAVLAIRGIPWFAMAAQLYLPVALGGSPARQGTAAARRINRVLAAVAAVLVVAAVGLTLGRDRSWFVSHWPEGAIAAVRPATEDGDTRVFATSRFADWILWRVPNLRGRLAWDIRFEIYSPETFERIVRFRGEQGADWKSLADGYGIVVLEPDQKPSHVADFTSEPGARVLYRDDRIVIVQRPGIASS
jgi:hypothetical protein